MLVVNISGTMWCLNKPVKGYISAMLHPSTVAAQMLPEAETAIESNRE
jgi:hypothetical protein